MEGIDTVQTKRGRNTVTNRWQIETPSPRDSYLSAPVGYSNQRIALSQAQAGQRVKTASYHILWSFLGHLKK